VVCPYCECWEPCGREVYPLPPYSRASEVFAGVLDMHSKDPAVLSLDQLYLQQELVMYGYFREDDIPSLVDIGAAQDLIHDTEL